MLDQLALTVPVAIQRATHAATTFALEPRKTIANSSLAVADTLRASPKSRHVLTPETNHYTILFVFLDSNDTRCGVVYLVGTFAVKVRFVPLVRVCVTPRSLYVCARLCW